LGVIMAHHRFWHSGVRDPPRPKLSLPLPSTTKTSRRGHESRKQHNELREWKAKKPEAPAKREERKRLFGYFSDKSGRTYSKAQISAYVISMRKGEIPKVPLDEKSVVYHPPESEKDVVESVGEIYVPKGKKFPAFKIEGGEVLIDPKRNFVSSVLK